MRMLWPFLLLLWWGCLSDPSPHALVVTVEHTTLYLEADLNSPALQTLQRGDPLADLGKVSDFEISLQYGPETRQAPWLLVKAPSGKQGWVFGGAVVPTDLHPDWLLQKRLLCYFGPALTARRNALYSPAPSPADAAQFARYYRDARHLRDTLLHRIAHRPEPGQSVAPPRYFWLKDALPGTVYQQVAAGTLPWLFLDYRYWHQLARHTPDKADDAFMQACLTAFPADSIESFAPAWVFPLSEQEVASRLGEGQHLKILQAIDQALAEAPLFRPELTALQQEVLEDIFDKNTRYWQPHEKIVKELRQILSTPPRSLSPAQLEELRLRLPMFEAPEQHGLMVNLRSGETTW